MFYGLSVPATVAVLFLDTFMACVCFRLNDFYDIRGFGMTDAWRAMFLSIHDNDPFTILR